MKLTLVVVILAAAISTAPQAFSQQRERPVRGNRQGGFAASQVEKLMGRMEAADGYLRADTLVEKDAALFPEKFRTKFPDPESIQALTALQAEIDRLAPRWTFPAGPHDARIEGSARAGVDNWHPGGSVLKTVMHTDPWKIQKNSLGIPLTRTRTGYVLYKRPSDSLCRQQSFTYTETFDGAGYQQSNGVRLNYARYLACK